MYISVGSIFTVQLLPPSEEREHGGVDVVSNTRRSFRSWRRSLLPPVHDILLHLPDIAQWKNGSGPFEPALPELMVSSKRENPASLDHLPQGKKKQNSRGCKENLEQLQLHVSLCLSVCCMYAYDYSIFEEERLFDLLFWERLDCAVLACLWENDRTERGYL